jgi:hypothetical protein
MIAVHSIKSAVLMGLRSLPVYPHKQTISEPVGTSHLCQTRKSLVRQSPTAAIWHMQGEHLPTLITRFPHRAAANNKSATVR